MSEKKVENNVEEKNINISIKGLGDKVFTFSGPPSELPEIESAVYALMSEIIVFKWRDNLIKKNEEEKKAVENSVEK